MRVHVCHCWRVLNPKAIEISVWQFMHSASLVLGVKKKCLLVFLSHACGPLLCRFRWCITPRIICLRPQCHNGSLNSTLTGPFFFLNIFCVLYTSLALPPCLRFIPLYCSLFLLLLPKAFFQSELSRESLLCANSHEMKFMVLLRDPTTRGVSSYWFKQPNQRGGSPNDFHATMAKEVAQRRR